MARKIINSRTTARSAKVHDNMNDIIPVLNDIDDNFSEVYSLLVAESLDTDIVPVSRTNNPIIAVDSANKNIDKLDAAIGADHTPVTRTVGQTAVANTVNQNIDALDSAIGFDNQMSGNPKNISSANSIYQNLDALDIGKTLRTIKVTVGAPGFGGTDFNFTSAANQSEQSIDLGALIPAKGRLVDIFVFTDAVFSNAVSLAADLGVTSGGDELITSGTIYAANAILASANAGAFILTPSASDQHVFINVTPGANWDAFSAGSISVYVSIIDVRNL